MGKSISISQDDFIKTFFSIDNLKYFIEIPKITDKKIKAIWK